MYQALDGVRMKISMDCTYSLVCSAFLSCVLSKGNDFVQLSSIEPPIYKLLVKDAGHPFVGVSIVKEKKLD